MKTRSQIMRALEKLSRIALKSNEGETPGEFYGRVHFVDGIRRCAMELANWINSDGGKRVHDAMDELHDADSPAVYSNGRARYLKVQIEPDLAEEVKRREMKLSDALNNALALHYKKQLRRSRRATRREPQWDESFRHGRLIQRVSIDEDLIEELNEQVDQIASKFKVQRYRSSILNASLRMYLWAYDMIDIEPECELPHEDQELNEATETSPENELVGVASG